ncbi:MAG: dephospho-CoA kinase [Bacteroidota bacterium]|nr:dephospho-CoA kinase [Bacteroidota bacterium]
MIKVGLTGNIGSGKSTVAKIFEIMNIPVFYADTAGKSMLKNKAVQQEIRDHFGKLVFDSKGTIDRKELAKIVFNNAKDLEVLNSIIHPRVRKEYLKWLSKNDSGVYSIHEAAILFESGFYKMLDRIIFVSAPEELRIERIMQRDNTSRESVIERISNQADEEKKMNQSDFVIVNNGQQMLLPQVLKIDKFLRSQVEE